jgi:hypothetical protein
MIIGGLWLWGAQASAVSLENAQWRVELQPESLALRVTPLGEQAVAVSTGAKAHRVNALHASAERVSWEWDEGAWALSAELRGRELRLAVSAREAGELLLFRQPGAAMGRGLIWPMAEGHYVPRGDPVWQRFLLDQGDLNTTQDLSLPLWGMDHGRFSLHWLMSTPWNNRLRPSADGDALAIEASHQFTTLGPGAPMTWVLYLGDGNLLAGAQRYRQWRIDNGQHQSLAAKLERVPEGRKLVGASHVYLWGDGLLGVDDVRDWPSFLAHLRGDQALASRLRGDLDGYSREVLATAPPAPLPHQRKALLRGLNGALDRYARESWQGAAEPDMQRLAQRYGEVRGEVAVAFGDALAPAPERWGETLSAGLIPTLQAAGLPRLWLGLGAGWEGGLWHPETIRAAVSSGYLIAPYDSYETALPADGNPDWTTAHLGRRAHRDCAVIRADGQPQKGFLQAGHYTTPGCMQPLLEARTSAVRAQAGFNSWFLDVTAAGMVFDSYRPGAPMTQAQNAEGNQRMAEWLGERGLVAGSEDGNAVTAGGIFYAHGMQTPVIGWGDADLSKNAKSPFYLGNWYPPEAPAVFFKPVPLKEPYRQVHFAPATRLPLYQAVFHGSLITSHHWTFDNFKLSNVRVPNELTQLLYNVAPLYHLSHDTLASRLPAIQRHDAFFRPVHEHLATQALVGFDWLSDDRLLQRTRFADGSAIIANFASQARWAMDQTVPGQSVMAVLANGQIKHYKTP